MKQLKKNALIDVHTHGMGIIMTHLLSSHYPYAQDIIDLSNKVREGGADYAVSFPMPTSIYYDVAGIKVHRYRRAGNCDFPFQYENLALVKSIKEFGLDNMLPFLAFSTRSKIEEQKEAVTDIIESYEVFGLKYHATIDRRGVLSKEFMQFADIARAYNIPILVHTKMDKWADPNYIISFAERNPEIRVCAAHCAHFNTDFFNRIRAKEINNLFVDCSPFTRICYDYSKGDKADVMNFAYDIPPKAFMQLFNEIPTHLLWGTDAPFNVFIESERVSEYKDEVDLTSDPLIREKLYENTCRFLFGD